MFKPLSIREVRENILLGALVEDARSVGELSQCVSFTRHDSRVRRLLSGLYKTGHVDWNADGEWRLTPRGLSRLQRANAA